MAEEVVRIRILAVADPSVRTAFAPLEEAADRASRRRRTAQAKEGQQSKAATEAEVRERTRGAAAVAREQARAAQQAERATKAASARVARENARVEQAAAKTADREARAVEKAQQAKTRSEMREFDKRIKLAEKEQKARERLREKEHAGLTRDAKKIETSEARKKAMDDRFNERRGAALKYSAAREVVGGTASNLRSIARAGVGLAGEVARGAGVNTDLGSAVGRNVDLEKLAVDLSNSGTNNAAANPGDRQARISPAEVTAKIKSVADATGVSRESAGIGMSKFVAKTGDLKAAMQVMEDLSQLAKATGTDLGDMGDAAGDVYQAMGADSKAMERLPGIMKTFAFQGKLGAVEMKDLAAQMAKVGASAGKYEGDAGDNMEKLGALVQLSRQKGGSTSAREAATSIARMGDQFATPERAAEFEKQGVQIFNKKTHEVRDPIEIIKDALEKTRKDDPTELNKMFKSVVGGRPVAALRKIYNDEYQARGGEKNDKEASKAARAKIDSEIARLRPSSKGTKEAMDKDFTESFKLAMDTNATKVQLFNNRMDDVAGRLTDRMAPALERAAPAIEKFANAFADAVSWAADNPGHAITAAIVASIAKAGLETAVNRALSNVLDKAMGGTGQGGVGGPGGAAGKAGGAGGSGFASGGMLAAVAVMALASKESFDSMMAGKDKALAGVQGTLGGGQEAITNSKVSTDSKEAKMKALEAALAANEAELANAQKGVEQKSAGGVLTTIGTGLFNASLGMGADLAGVGLGPSKEELSRNSEAAAQLQALQAQNDALKAEMARVAGALGGVLNVNVMNPTPGAPPGVDNGARVGP